jgi:hypothetical protein
MFQPQAMLTICVYLWRAKYCCRPWMYPLAIIHASRIAMYSASQQTHCNVQSTPTAEIPKDSHPSHPRSHGRKTRTFDGRPHFSSFVAGCCELRLERLNWEDGELGANILLGFNGCLDLTTPRIRSSTYIASCVTGVLIIVVLALVIRPRPVLASVIVDPRRMKSSEPRLLHG